MQRSTKIPNQIIEALAGSDLTGEEFRVLMAIIRKTYGYDKKCDYIAFSQLAKLTKMSRQNINRNVKNLEKKGVISVVRDDYRGINNYSLIGSDYFIPEGVVKYDYNNIYNSIFASADSYSEDCKVSLLEDHNKADYQNSIDTKESWNMPILLDKDLFVNNKDYFFKSLLN